MNTETTDLSDSMEAVSEGTPKASGRKRIPWVPVIYGILILLLPMISLFMSECVHNVNIYNFSPQGTVANYILFAVIYGLGMVLTGTVRRSVLLMTPLIFLFSVVTEAVLQFRGTPAMPADILSIATGLNVAGGYHFSPNPGLAAGAAVMLLMMLTAWFTPFLKRKQKGPVLRRIICRIIPLILIAAVTFVFYTTDFAADHKVRPDFWDQARGYRNSGTLLNFVLNSKYLIIKSPEGYSSFEVNELMQQVLSEAQDDPGILKSAAARQEMLQEQAADLPETEELPSEEADSQENQAADQTTKGAVYEIAVTETSDTNQPRQSARLRKNQVPDIIVIMNETWSDLRVLGEFETNEDCFAFTRNLTKNTIKGNLYMPVIGAGTSNSEFEFLTGNSMAFLTGGSNAYELYIKSQLPSLVRTLEAQGYSRTGLHPYYGNSWKRNTNYPLLGFERFISIEDIFGQELVEKQRNNEISFAEFRDQAEAMYPSQQVLLRRFVSDSFDFQYLTDLYKERDREKPFFLFNVTMQNHGGYDSGYTNFEQKIRLTSGDSYYPKTNRFLSLMYETDQALKELITHFSSISRPTIILMFGDHQPSIETEFVEEVMGKKISELTLSEKQKRYITPFVLWANYNIPEGYIDQISANYLSTLLLQTAGLQTTQYNDYLSALYRKIPVIDAAGYITADGVCHSYSEATEVSELLKGYEKIQYNNLFDLMGRQEELFYPDTEQIS